MLRALRARLLPLFALYILPVDLSVCLTYIVSTARMSVYGVDVRTQSVKS